MMPVPLRSVEYHAKRNEAERWLVNYRDARHFDDGYRRLCLEKALDAQREAERLELAFIASLPPCRMCGRRVTSPCNDAEGYYEGGPWDATCEVYAKGS